MKGPDRSTQECDDALASGIDDIAGELDEVPKQIGNLKMNAEKKKNLVQE
jgi:hypothetical protein